MGGETLVTLAATDFLGIAPSGSHRLSPGAWLGPEEGPLLTARLTGPLARDTVQRTSLGGVQIRSRSWEQCELNRR